jgi:hypothetical protein
VKRWLSRIAWLALLWGCGAPEPGESVACPIVTRRWEAGGHLLVVSCRRISGNSGEEAGMRTHAMQLELDLNVLNDTQIFASSPLLHKSGPEGRGSQRPAGEVVTIREELQLVETEEGWKARH